MQIMCRAKHGLFFENLNDNILLYLHVCESLRFLLMPFVGKPKRLYQLSVNSAMFIYQDVREFLFPGLGDVEPITELEPDASSSSSADAAVLQEASEFRDACESNENAPSDSAGKSLAAKDSSSSFDDKGHSTGHLVSAHHLQKIGPTMSSQDFMNIIRSARSPSAPPILSLKKIIIKHSRAICAAAIAKRRLCNQRIEAEKSILKASSPVPATR